MHYSISNLMNYSPNFNTVWLSLSACYFCMGIGCTAQDSQKSSSTIELEAEPDLSKLPSSLRRRLLEGEARIKVLKEQKVALESQLETLERLEIKYQSDPSSSPTLLAEA